MSLFSSERNYRVIFFKKQRALISFAKTLFTANFVVISAKQRFSIVIFDQATSGTLKELIPGDCQFLILPTRGETYFISPSIALQFIFNLFRSKKLKMSYFWAVLKQVRPNLVLTRTYGDRNFYLLSNHYVKAHFFAFQTGWLFPSNLNPLKDDSSYNVRLGLATPFNQMLLENKHHVDLLEVLMVGLTWPNLSEEDLYRDCRLPIGRKTLLYVSQYRSDWNFLKVDTSSDRNLYRIKTPSSMRDYDINGFLVKEGNQVFHINQKTNIQWLQEIANELHMDFFVQLFYDVNKYPIEAKKEEQYFLDLHLTTDQLLPNNTAQFQSFCHLATASTIASYQSTMALQALSQGLRVLISQPCCDEREMGNPLPWWWLQNHGKEALKEAVIRISNTPSRSWQRDESQALWYYGGKGLNFRNTVSAIIESFCKKSRGDSRFQ